MFIILRRHVIMSREAEPGKLVKQLAEKLKGKSELKPPDWSRFVKTGAHNERPPQQDDWWWLRAASILRKLKVKGSLGVSRFRKEYGGRKNRGHKPEHKYKASGAIIRKILQQLEAAGLVRKEKKKGRILTRDGEALLNEAAKGLKGGK